MSHETSTHPMIREVYNGRESLFACTAPDCGHRMVLDHATGGVTLVQRGPDPFARHVGTTPGVGFSASVTPQDPSQAA